MTTIDASLRRTRRRPGRVGDRLEHVAAAQADATTSCGSRWAARRPRRCRRQILAAIAAIELGAPDAYDYAATEGDPPLHAALLETLRGTSDETTADRLTITAGGMQGLDLFCKIFVDPGDLVMVESPTYTNGSATALSYGADAAGDPGRRRRHGRRRARATGRGRRAHAEGDLHDPDVPEPVRRDALAGAPAAAARAGPGVGIDGDRRRPVRSAALRGRAAADAARARRRRSAGVRRAHVLQDRRARAAGRLGRHRARAAAAADQREAGDGHLHEPARAAAADRLPRPAGTSRITW